MRVIYLHQHFSDCSGAAPTRSYGMATRLVERGHSVLMVCGSYSSGSTGLTSKFERGSRRGKKNGFEVVEFDLKYSNKLRYFGRLVSFIKFMVLSTNVVLTEQADVVIASSTPLTVGIPGVIFRVLKKRKFIFEVRDLWPELPQAMGVIENRVLLWALRALESLIYKSASRIIALSPGIEDGIAATGIHRRKILMIPNSSDLLTLQTKTNEHRPDFVGSKDLMAVYTGTHGQANGLDVLVDVAEVLTRRGVQDIKIILVGDGATKKELQRRAKILQLKNLFFLEPLDRGGVAAILRGADIGLQILKNVPAFYYGTSPNKFFDYLAMGLPIVTNYPGWVADLIRENRCGFVTPACDATAFADLLVKIQSERESLAEMGGRSHALARRHFDREQLADEWVTWVTLGNHRTEHVS